MFSSAFLSVLLLTLLAQLTIAAPASKSVRSLSLGKPCKITADCKDGLVCNTESYTCSKSAVVRQASNVPAGWTCEPSFYNSNDGCDCGCGVVDPDCNKEDQSLFCEDGSIDSEDAKCDLDIIRCIPKEWTCTGFWYDADDGCDCECGATDPDCNKEGQSLFCPNSPVNASRATCDLTTNKCVPNAWTCNTSWYNAGDGCDCGCGATDPDCVASTRILMCHNSPLSRLVSICNLETNECELDPNRPPSVETPPRPRRRSRN